MTHLSFFLLSSSLLTWHPLSALLSPLSFFLFSSTFLLVLYLHLSLPPDTTSPLFCCSHVSSPLPSSPLLSMKHPQIKHSHAHVHPAAAQLITQWIYSARQHSLWPWYDQSPLKGGVSEATGQWEGSLSGGQGEVVWRWDKYQENILVLFDSLIMFSFLLLNFWVQGLDGSKKSPYR